MNKHHTEDNGKFTRGYDVYSLLHISGVSTSHITQADIGEQ